MNCRTLLKLLNSHNVIMRQHHSLFDGGAEGNPPLKPFELLGYEGPAGG